MSAMDEGVAGEMDYCPNLVEVGAGIEKPCDYPRDHSGPHGTVVGEFIVETVTCCDAESNGHACELESIHGDAFQGPVAHRCRCGQTWADKHPCPCRSGEGEIEDALLEIPPRFREGKALKESIQALVQALIDAEGAAIALAINAEPVDESRDATGRDITYGERFRERDIEHCSGEYQRGRVELAEELAALIGEQQPGKHAWHYVMGALDIITIKAEVMR